MMTLQYVYTDKKDSHGLFAYQMSNDFQISSLTNSKYRGSYLRKVKDTN